MCGWTGDLPARGIIVNWDTHDMRGAERGTAYGSGNENVEASQSGSSIAAWRKVSVEFPDAGGDHFHGPGAPSALLQQTGARPKLATVCIATG
jgi:hypothetical protein